jgi:isopentenyl diphosphate isomerase/L-lactate dehydrogenase-like FMN-dependent dehydrogenase
MGRDSSETVPALDGRVSSPGAETRGQQQTPRTISELVRGARQRLSPTLWDYASGGVGSETTLRRNRQAMELHAFRPELMRGPGSPDISTSFLGLELAAPVVFAPIGTIALFADRGALAPAAVAASQDLLSFNSVISSPGLSEVGSTGSGRAALQLYIRGGRPWLERVVREAEDSGYHSVCVTADSIGGGSRDRDLLSGFIPSRATAHPNLLDEGVDDVDHQLLFTWDDLAWLRSVTSLPLMVKGVTTPEDARVAVEHGADAVYVSNHGGRSLDGLPATLEVLPEIVAELRGDAEVLVDGGFLRGTDVVKAIALGARAVGIGKLQAWALAADGERGLTRAVEILRREIHETLQLLGCPSLAQLTDKHLRSSFPTQFHATDFGEFTWAPMPRV